MGGAMSRNKGAAAERSVFKLLSAKLGIKIERNLSQTRAGGADSQECIGKYAIEIKRAERLLLNDWWAQACTQANKIGTQARPLLLYRQSRHEWRGIVRCQDLFDTCGVLGHMALEGTVDLSLDQIAELLQRELETPELRGTI